MWIFGYGSLMFDGWESDHGCVLLGGQIQVMFVTAPLSLAHIQSGKLRPLAYTAAHRWSVLPEVPTMAEAGIQNFVMDGGWYGMFAPARTPAEIIDRLDSEVKPALTVPSVRENYAALGLSPRWKLR